MKIISKETSKRVCDHMNNDHIDSVHKYLIHYGEISLFENAYMEEISNSYIKINYDGHSAIINFKKPNTEEKLYLIIEHLDELIKEKGDHGLLIARKHISWTCKDFKGASNLRNELVRAVDKNEVKNLINKMIKTLNKEKNTLV